MNTDGNGAVTSFLAVWGAILSSITFGWALYKDLRDKAKISLTAQLRRIGQREGDGAWFASEPSLNIRGLGDELFIVVSVTNVGRRRMNWRGLGGTYRTAVDGRSSFVISARELPKMLEEQDSHSEFTAVEKQFGTGNVKGIQIWDGAGRKWHVSKRDMKRLWKDIEKYAQPPEKQTEPDQRI
jgi:hypothetical protein